MQCWAQPLLPTRQRNTADASAGRGRLRNVLRWDVTERKAKARPKEVQLLTTHFSPLVSNQDLRTTVIAGHPDLGQPDWRNCAPSKVMTAQELQMLSPGSLPRERPIPASHIQGASKPKWQIKEKRFCPTSRNHMKLQRGVRWLPNRYHAATC